MGPLKRYLARQFMSGGNNILTLDNPYEVMGKLLANDSVRSFIDVGASHGRVSKRILQQFPNALAYAFEPNPAYKTILEKETIKEPRLKPQYLAVGDSNGTAQLNITHSPGTTSLHKPNATLTASYPEEARVVEVCEVPLVTLDSWAEEVAATSIELIKLDIQGGELAALRGAEKLLSTSVRLVYTEIMFNRLYEGGAVFADLDALLRDHGFALYDIYKPKYNERGMLMWGNAIYLIDR